MTSSSVETPEGVFTPLDTDLYKLTMQCAILKFFPNVRVEYKFTNRTDEMRLNRAAYDWLQRQISNLANIRITDDEVAWLQKTCPYLGSMYLDYLRASRFKPAEHIVASFTPVGDGDDDADESAFGQLDLSVKGLWLETILFEVPLLALTSEAYFKFVDKEWSHAGQVAKATRKCAELIENGCTFSEFGSRRRRDYATQDMVMQGIMQAVKEAEHTSQADVQTPTSGILPGKFSGTSNVHFAMKYDCAPVGTVAHEWTMGIAAFTDDPASSNEAALRYWVRAFGRGTLAIALTDTFGTEDFLRSFSKPAVFGDDDNSNETSTGADATYADVFSGVRQDSGDPLDYLRRMKDFYTSQGILPPASSSTPRKVIVYSDSLNTQKCIKYARATEETGLVPSFGIGTFFTNDFVRRRSAKPSKDIAQHDSQAHAGDYQEEDGEKSKPLNIVIKLYEVEGRAAVKLSDDIGKNMGDENAVRRYKEAVGYHDHSWDGADEKNRW